MPTAEPELTIELEEALGEEGVNINTSVEIRRLERTESGVRVHAEVEGEERCMRHSTCSLPLGGVQTPAG